MKNSNRDRQFTEQDVLSIERMATPDSARLQNSIINLTRELPQYTDQSEVAKVYNLSAFLDKVKLKKRFSIGFNPYAASIAAGLAVIALSSTLWLPSQNDPLLVEDYTLMSTEKLANEIEWQDLMLLNDELAFAGL